MYEVDKQQHPRQLTGPFDVAYCGFDQHGTTYAAHKLCAVYTQTLVC